ncbi:MAG: RNA degradosome polyphosphate kinase [Nocardioidaceae bacterium]|nr:RNA degradosome polyphosphate kinase [Nocardioidaceae bacterium]
MPADHLTESEAVPVEDAPASPDSFDVDPPYDPVDGPLPEDRFLDRELSWLTFNERVLELVEDPDLPLLERVRFGAIFASNLDEFFMVRVAGLKRRMAAGVAVRSVSGLNPREVLAQSLRTSHDLMLRQGEVFRRELVPALAEAGIALLRWNELTEDERKAASEKYRERVFPVLTPLAVDPAHPFPYISGLSLNLAVVIRNPTTGKEHFARVKVPPNFDRWVRVGPERFVPLDEVIAAHLDLLFPGMDVVAHHTFRVTRNEDLEVEEDDAENLLQALEKELLRRKFGPPVRLEVEESIDDQILDLLVSELDVTADEVFRLPGPLDLRSLNQVADLDHAELKFDPFVPGTHPHLAEVETASPADMFAALRERDVLVHHPYDSFATSVQRFVEQAAADPKVLAIKMTLYRTSGDSPLIDSLVDAARSGKQVLVLVEIKARFDEQANIRWARKLERAGCHVVYGMVGLKTHCKLSLVVRDEPDGLRRYAHVGTGNYNPKTARMYEDVGLLTSDTEIADDLTDLFNNLSGYSRHEDYRRLLVAPAGVRTGILDLIEREVEHHRAGRPALIRIKVNSLVDELVIDALFAASRAGVPVDLVTRGICTLRPGVPGLSETIRVRSILGRFLEHSRIFWFANGGDAQAWIGSADLMHRNLDRRVEALVQIPTAKHVDELGELLEKSVSDETSAWWLGPDGVWTRHHLAEDGTPLLDLQAWLIAKTRERRARQRHEAATDGRRPGAGTRAARGWPFGRRTSR